MRAYHLTLACALALSVLLGGCEAALQRGVAGGAYVSSARPAMTVAAKGMAVLTDGRGFGTLLSPSMTGSLSPETRVGVYGSAPDRPMAVIAHAELPSRWMWTTPRTRFGGVNEGSAVIGGKTFHAYTYLVPVKSDAFAGLAGEEAPEGVKTLWLARHFSARVSQNRGKLILEYREPVPAGVESLADPTPEMAKLIEAFEERAAAAFTMEALESRPESVRNGYAKGVHWTSLTDSFLGDVTERIVRFGD